MKQVFVVLIALAAIASPSFAKDKKAEKGSAKKTEQQEKIEAFANANPEDVKLFERVFNKVVDGCNYLWPYSEALRKRCVTAEMNNFNEALAAGELGK